MAKVALASPAQVVKARGRGSVNYVADWVMDVLDDLVGRVEQDITVETSIDPGAAGRRPRRRWSRNSHRRGRSFGVGQGALVAMSPDGACARWSADAITPRANTIARSPPSGSRAPRSSRSSI